MLSSLNARLLLNSALVALTTIESGLLPWRNGAVKIWLKKELRSLSQFTKQNREQVWSPAINKPSWHHYHLLHAKQRVYWNRSPRISIGMCQIPQIRRPTTCTHLRPASLWWTSVFKTNRAWNITAASNSQLVVFYTSYLALDENINVNMLLSTKSLHRTFPGKCTVFKLSAVLFNQRLLDDIYIYRW